MPITLPVPPRGGAARLIDRLQDLLRERPFPPEKPLRLESLSHSEPHPVFFAPLDALADDLALLAGAGP